MVIKLDKPTRDGETEIALLSNVWDDKVDALQLAELYRKRWIIESLFLVLTEALTCEKPGLNYPKAALFGFCMTLIAYNVLALVKATLRSCMRQLIERTLSLYRRTLRDRRMSLCPVNRRRSIPVVKSQRSRGPLPAETTVFPAEANATDLRFGPCRKR